MLRQYDSFWLQKWFESKLQSNHIHHGTGSVVVNTTHAWNMHTKKMWHKREDTYVNHSCNVSCKGSESSYKPASEPGLAFKSLEPWGFNLGSPSPLSFIATSSHVSLAWTHRNVSPCFILWHYLCGVNQGHQSFATVSSNAKGDPNHWECSQKVCKQWLVGTNEQ